MTVLDRSTGMNLKASKRKLITQGLTHSMRQAAQLAMFFRQNGMKQDWIHDFLLSSVME